MKFLSPRLIPCAAATVVLAFAAAGCRTGRTVKPGGDDSSVISATIQGISPEDAKAAAKGLSLLCSGDAVVVRGELIDNTTASFPAGTRVNDGDECALEMRRDALPTDDQYVWFGTRDSGKEKQVGLLYASNRGKVKDRKLALIVYKLYEKKIADAYTLNVKVTVPADAFTADDKAAGAPQAELECGDQGRFAGTFSAAVDAAPAVASFPNLDPKTFKLSACTWLVLRVIKTGAYAINAAKLAWVDRPQPAGAAAAALDWPDVVPLVKSADASPVCFKRADTGKCADRRSVELPSPNVQMFAEVIALDKGRNIVSYLVHVGPSVGTFADANNDKTDATFSTASLNDDRRLGKQAYSFFAAKHLDALRAMPIKEARDIPKTAGGVENLPLDAVSEALFLHINAVYIHAFHYALVEGKTGAKKDTAQPTAAAPAAPATPDPAAPTAPATTTTSATTAVIPAPATPEGTPFAFVVHGNSPYYSVNGDKLSTGPAGDYGIYKAGKLLPVVGERVDSLAYGFKGDPKVEASCNASIDVIKTMKDKSHPRRDAVPLADPEIAPEPIEELKGCLQGTNWRLSSTAVTLEAVTPFLWEWYPFVPRGL